MGNLSAWGSLSKAINTFCCLSPVFETCWEVQKAKTLQSVQDWRELRLFGPSLITGILSTPLRSIYTTTSRCCASDSKSVFFYLLMKTTEMAKLKLIRKMAASWFATWGRFQSCELPYLHLSTPTTHPQALGLSLCHHSWSHSAARQRNGGFLSFGKLANCVSYRGYMCKVVCLFVIGGGILWKGSGSEFLGADCTACTLWKPRELHSLK